MGNIFGKRKRPSETTSHTGKVEPQNIVEDEQTKIVKSMVSRYLKDEHMNSKYIPDFIEERLYANMLRVSLGLLKDTVEHVQVDILGHRIKMTMEPLTSESI